MTVSDASINVDFFAPEVVEDPYPMLEEIKSRGRLVYHEGMDLWLVTEFEDIKWVMAKPETFNFPPEFESMQSQGVKKVTGYDDEHHDEVRAIWADDFHRTYVQNYREWMTPMIGNLVEPFVERLRAGEAVDVVEAVTKFIPTFVITRLAGLDPERMRQHSHWAEEISFSSVAAIDPDPKRRQMLLDRASQATDELMAELTREVIRRETEETDDLIGRKSPDPSLELSREERAANIGGFMFAGYDTTSKLIAHSALMLARYPEQRQLLAEDFSRIPWAIEEIMRYCGIVMMLPRRTTEEIEVCGQMIPKGGLLMMMISMANRDPERWEDPYRFDITRKPKLHFGFGFGMHNCLGQNLAKLEATVFIEELLSRLPDYELAEEPDFGNNFFIRGPRSLKLKAAG